MARSLFCHSRSEKIFLKIPAMKIKKVAVLLLAEGIMRQKCRVSLDNPDKSCYPLTSDFWMVVACRSLAGG
jgi:hypothetical protein